MQNNTPTAEQAMFTNLKNYSKNAILAIEIEMKAEKLREIIILSHRIEKYNMREEEEDTLGLGIAVHDFMSQITRYFKHKTEMEMLIHDNLLSAKNNHPDDESLQKRIDNVENLIASNKDSMCLIESTIMESIKNELEEEEEEDTLGLGIAVHDFMSQITRYFKHKTEMEMLIHDNLLSAKNNHPDDESLQKRIDNVENLIASNKDSMCLIESTIMESIKNKLEEEEDNDDDEIE